MGVLNSFEDYEIAESFNRETTLDDNTKLLIVGTLTPPDGKGKYFYSTRNSVYGLIDEALETPNNNNGIKLVNLKKRFNSDESNNQKVREEIKKHLKKNKIAFLDVVKYAVRNKHSSDDKDIMIAELDYDVFKDLKNVQNIIVNSEDAARAFCDIKTKNESKGSKYENIKIGYLPQTQRSSNFSRENWADAIKNGPNEESIRAFEKILTSYKKSLVKKQK